MNVYDIADKLLEKLSEEASGSLETLDVNAKTFGNIKTLLKTYKLQPNYDDLMKMSGRKKSNDVSVKFRLKGNELFKDRKYFRALCAYNKSLCFAEARSETLGLAFANRSAVYMEIDEFDLCRENIDLAKRFGYPKNKFNKLDERKKFCLSKQQVKQAGRIFFVLSHNPNSNYPFIADCLSLKQCFKFGRHVVTDETLEIGDVIAIEPPFSSILLSTCIDKRCMKCLGQHKLNLLPCSGCTSGRLNRNSYNFSYFHPFIFPAMFCSSECENKANDKFHHIECDFSCEDFDNFFTTAIKAAFRTFLQAFSIFEGSIEKLRQYLMKNVERDLTAFDLNFNNKDEVYQRDVILAMNALSTNEEKRQVVEKFRRAIVCTILSEFLQSYSRLKDALRNEENEIFFLSFMFRHIQIAESNYHELYALSPVKLHQDNEQFGVGSFPFSSLLNHSCAPNVLRLTFNGFNCIVVSRKIQKGEQVFDNYG